MRIWPKKEKWSYEIGWRYLSYTEGNGVISFSIEPMLKTNDIVYVVTAENWKSVVPSVFSNKRETIIGRLKSVAWNRKLDWQDTCDASPHDLNSAVHGSII